MRHMVVANFFSHASTYATTTMRSEERRSLHITAESFFFLFSFFTEDAHEFPPENIPGEIYYKLMDVKYVNII